MPRSDMWPPAPCAQTKSAPPGDASAGSKVAEVSSPPTLTRHSPALTGKRALFHPILDFGEGRAGALLVELAAGGAAHADRADRLAAGLDRHSALRIGHVGQRSLRNRGRSGLGHAVGDRLGASFL